METTTIQTGNQWVKITDAADSQWTMQNIGDVSVYVAYSNGGAPDPNADGIVLGPMKGLSSSIHGVGEVWARNYINSDGGKISITK